jgi:beta-phosphoglucomutase
MGTINGVIFDLDGVVLSTDNYHYLAWKKLADREGIYFDRDINERLRGVSRMASLEIILERADREYSPEEKEEMATYKNDIYRDSLKHLNADEIFPGVLDFIDFLRQKEIPIAVGSSSKNTKFILQQIGLTDVFSGAVSDGTNITKSKPDPEVFLKAADMIKTPPAECLVIEDAEAGIKAALNGGMFALGVGPMKDHPKAHYHAVDIQAVDRSIFNA